MRAVWTHPQQPKMSLNRGDNNVGEAQHLQVTLDAKVVVLHIMPLASEMLARYLKSHTGAT